MLSRGFWGIIVPDLTVVVTSTKCFWHAILRGDDWNPSNAAHCRRDDCHGALRTAIDTREGQFLLEDFHTNHSHDEPCVDGWPVRDLKKSPPKPRPSKMSEPSLQENASWGTAKFPQTPPSSINLSGTVIVNFDHACSPHNLGVSASNSGHLV